MDLDASNGGGGEDDDNDAFFVDDTVFELQASLATMQAEVSQYQKQNQQQQATIRQLQYEISQANLQRQVMQEKLQKQQAPATLPRHHAAPQPVAPPQPPTRQPNQPQQQQHAATTTAAATTTNTSVSPSPSKSKLNAATATDSKQATVDTATTTTSLGTFLCRTLLTANTNDNNNNNNNNSKQAKHDHRLVTAVWQKMQPHQDASLLALVVEYSLAYLVAQRQPEQASQNKTTTTATTPLPFLYYSLVFTQGRPLSATDNNDNHNAHLGTCTTTTSGTKRPLRLRMVNSAQPPSLPSNKSKDMMIMSSYRIQQTIQAVLQYGIFLLQKQVDDNASKARQEQEDLLHVFRLLTLPAANAIEWSDNKEDQNDFGPLLWDWITQNLHPRVTAVALPQAPRRYARCATTTTTSERIAAPLEHITAALCLGRFRTNTARGHTHTTQQQSWIRSLVAVSSDWIHFVLLPCFALYYRPNTSTTRSSPDENDPSTKDTIDDDSASTRSLDQMSSLACELIQTWQYLFGVDSDWLRTQLALPKKADEAAPSASSSSSSSLTGRTHATCMLQLACRLLQAIAVEDNVRVRESFGALQACLLRFLGPIVARHAAWLDTSSRLEYTSALARLKAQSSADSLVLACWESAREDPVVMGG